MLDGCRASRTDLRSREPVDTIADVAEWILRREKQSCALRPTEVMEQEQQDVPTAAALRRERLATEPARTRGCTPPGSRSMAEDLVRESRNER